MTHAINWFELPVKDIERATKFYEAILGAKLRREVFGGMQMAIFPKDETSVGGALTKFPERGPSAQGTLVYLNANGQLDAVLSRIGDAGGKVILPKTDIGDPGFIGIFSDSEGNVVGVHSER
jgi:predicted enzyme related to lactoylglutathione lyase